MGLTASNVGDIARRRGLALVMVLGVVPLTCGDEVLDSEVAELELGDVAVDSDGLEPASDLAGPFGPVAQVAGFERHRVVHGGRGCDGGGQSLLADHE